MLDIGAPELLIVLVIVLLIFGPGRLAGLGAALGQAMREFRQGVQEAGDERSEQKPGQE
jgi:sec-independent protein translocase protein TatA